MNHKMQREYIGCNAILNIKDILDAEKPKKILLVTGGSSYVHSGAQKLLSSLLSGYLVVRFFDFKTNPQIEDVRKGIKIYQEEGCDFIIAVGGGSVLDIAKSINILIVNIADPEEYVQGNKVLSSLGKGIVAIPTTAGTGSEATHFAVVYVDKKKYSLEHPSMLPKYVIVDPQLTFSLTKDITAFTGMDAFTQAMESYWSIQSTPLSKSYAEEAIRLILSNFEFAVNKPTISSRIAMARAANLSGKAINISKTTACHALSYPMTSYFGIPHGHAVGITLGAVLAYNYEVTADDCLDPRGVKYVKDSILSLCHLLDVSTPEKAQHKIKSLMKKVGLTTTISELGISQAKVEHIIRASNPERMKNNPRALTVDDLKMILHNS